MLKLKNGWLIKGGMWETLQVVNNRLGVRVSFDQPGKCVRMYGGAEEPGGIPLYLGVVDANDANWESVAHAYLQRQKVESPWEEV
jgi:hypothetical protein